MPQNNETNLEYKQRVLDTKSKSFCGAKWGNATIWLGSGMTTSCHHPPAHKIDEQVIVFNPKALHNTEQKKKDRQMMQNGDRPTGCEYCWKIEDCGTDAISDRVYKSIIYKDEQLQNWFNTPPDQDINLKTLEIAFDRTCQFACSYCNPAFSTAWAKDINKNGPYENLISDGRNHFTHPHDASQLYKPNETNPYIEAFFKWWDSDLHQTLQELRITGGEPLMSPHTWKLIEWFKVNQGKSTTKLAINSNLGYDSSTLNKFIDAIRPLPHVELYTSNESVGEQAEYIRDGINYQQWLNNVTALLESNTVKSVHCMCTINALCLDSLPEFLIQLVKLKKKYGKEAVNFTLNILRFPSFQSPLILPQTIRAEYVTNLTFWLTNAATNPLLHRHEIDHTQRLIDYLGNVTTPHSETTFDTSKLHNDVKQFYSQYDVRRKKDFSTTFPRLANWYNSL
jgi:organic radical activating enzyme